MALPSESVKLYYCKTLYFRCILISRFWKVEISLHFNWRLPSVLLVFTWLLMGKLNFCGYLISRPTREIRENLMHTKNMCFAVCENWKYLCFLIFVSLRLLSYSNFVSANEGRCKFAFSSLPSSSYLFALLLPNIVVLNEINGDWVEMEC